MNQSQFDAIIVGSGPSGATVAKELGKRRKKVLILERGDDRPLKENVVAIASIVNTVPVSDDLTTTRAFTTGGTTTVYFAEADPPPLEAFRSFGIDMSREYEEAKGELPLAVLPDELLGTQSIRLRESAEDLGYSWQKNMMLVDLSKCGSGYRYEAKWNARVPLREAVESGATLITKAKVIRVLVENRQAVGVEYTLDGKEGKDHSHRVFGGKIVLAAGASASPIILRDSGMRNIGNQGFYCCPSFAVFGTVSGLSAGETFPGCMGVDLGDNLVLGDANIARTFYRLFMLRKGRVVRAFSHSKSIGVGVMVREGIGGELQGNGRYHKELKSEDLKKLDKGEKVAHKIIQNAGGKDVIKSALGTAHLGGLIKLKEHLDENMQTEYTNLHVCDGSVMPESAQIAPTLTLVCLGKYLASRLAA